mmetsp:Transcript_11926/g.35722  ORF Transcript_11926/g.35722 Transcript_11926/m.35722 type:complete len:211 (+) Transcript_11926:549-1181(+)
MPDPAPTPTAIEVNARNFLSAKSSVWQCSEAGGGAEDVEHLQVQHDLPHNAPSGSGLDDDARQETKSCKPPVRHLDLASIRPLAGLRSRLLDDVIALLQGDGGALLRGLCRTPLLVLQICCRFVSLAILLLQVKEAVCWCAFPLGICDIHEVGGRSEVAACLELISLRVNLRVWLNPQERLVPHRLLGGHCLGLRLDQGLNGGKESGTTG